MKDLSTLLRVPSRRRSLGLLAAGSVALLSTGALALSGGSASAYSDGGAAFTGQASAVSISASLLGQPLVPVTTVQGTGPVATDVSSTTPTPCALNPIIRNVLVSGDLCANVTTLSDAGISVAHASVANLALGLVTLPTIAIQGVASSSTSGCGGSFGSTTIAYLRIGTTVVIAKPTAIAPNTVVNVGVVKLVLNQQIPDYQSTSGLTVNAIALTVNALGLAQLNLDVASSQSGVNGCLPT